MNTRDSEDRDLLGVVQSPERQFLSFVAGDQRFATPILSVVEVVRYSPPTVIPHTPAFIRGVMNLRGQVVPIVDLGERFGFATAELASTACVVVTEFESRGVSGKVGIVVDRIDRVLDLEEDGLQPAPSFGVPVDADYLTGMLPTEAGMVPVIDLPGVLSDLEAEQVAGVARVEEGEGESESSEDD